MQVNRVAQWGALLIAVACMQSGVAQERSSVGRDYAQVIAACGRTGPDRVSFFTAFGGLWPVPSNLVLVDAANNRLEYSDLAYPWQQAPRTSRIFFGGKESLERRWPNLFSRQDGVTTQKCSLQVTKYAHWDSFDEPVVVISNSREYLLLVGPISDAATAALECYAATSPRLKVTGCN